MEKNSPGSKTPGLASWHSMRCAQDSVMKKNPRIYLERKTENNKKTQTCKMFKKRQNQP